MGAEVKMLLEVGEEVGGEGEEGDEVVVGRARRGRRMIEGRRWRGSARTRIKRRGPITTGGTSARGRWREAV